MDESDHGRLAALTQAARDGDLEAYGRIVELTRAAVETAARLILHDPDDAEDVAQDTYLQAFHRFGELKDATCLLAWLQRISRNLALNRRRGERWSFVRGLDVSQIAAPVPDSGEREAALARALTGLADEDRRLCERYYHGGWTTARLAGQMGVSEVAVRKRLQRMRERLREGMSMNATELPQRIVELLSKPNLTAIPENPVGAIWEEFRRQYDGFVEVDVPEKIDPDEVRRILGDASRAGVEEYLDAASRQEWLRRELTVSMLVAAGGKGAPPRLIARGKTYRLGDEESRTCLHAFHQAEILWIQEGLSEWQIMGPFTGFIERLGAGARLRIDQAEYSLYCDRGWQVCALWPGKDWSSVAGWGRMRAAVVERLGYDPSRFTAVGLGCGLERLAMLRYGIDDIRKVEAERIQPS